MRARQHTVIKRNKSKKNDKKYASRQAIKGIKGWGIEVDRERLYCFVKHKFNMECMPCLHESLCLVVIKSDCLK